MCCVLIMCMYIFLSLANCYASLLQQNELEVRRFYTTCMYFFLNVQETILHVTIFAEEYKDVQSNFSSKVPCVLFTDSERGLTCQLTIGSELARETNLLLLMYTKCDPRFRRLAVVFRYWAQVSSLWH